MFSLSFGRKPAGPRRRPVTRRTERGFSLVETSVFLGTAAVLASTLATVGFQSMETARTIVARDDVERIGAALGQLLIDRGNLMLLSADGDVIDLLASSGPVPETSDAVLGRPLDGATAVDLEDALYSNEVGLPESTSPWEPGWRGPYLQLTSDRDPWGHRYAVRLAGDAGQALYVISAGPDAVIQSDTAGRFPRSAGDDVLFLLSVSR